MKKEVIVVRDLNSIKLCVEDTRSEILSLLRVRDMSISQLAEALDRDQSTIYRHLQKLKKAGFVEEAGKRKVHHIPEKLYSRAASVFIFSPTDDSVLHEKDSISSWDIQHNFNAQRIISLMNTLGYEVDDTEENIDKLSIFFSNLDEKTSELIEEFQDELSGINFPTILRLKLLLFIYEVMDNKERNREAKDIFKMFKK